MQDSNPRDALTPTTVFKTVALPDSANPPYSVVWSRCQESNLVRRFIRALHRPPCSTSFVRGGRQSPRIRKPAYPPRTRRPVPLPGLEPGTSAFVVRRSVHLSHRGEVETSARLHRRSAWPPLQRRGRALGNVFGYQRFAEMGSVEHRRRESNPLENGFGGRSASQARR
jgi:hypothetical protein